MDIDDAKENIQPLAQGRNASILHASLRTESAQELLVQRKVLEKEIHDYNGDDPLSVWYNYIEWIEQSFPSGGKESGLQEVLSKCLAQFESDERYKQDRRMIKLYIKFIDSHKDPSECYQQLFNAGIGTMIADFYIAWAYCYDLVGNTRKADEVFLRGIACRAQPLEDLQEARQHFGFSVAQRFMYKDDDLIREETNRQLHERRVALTSLRAHRRNQVGSIRTGSAIKSGSPAKAKVDLPSTSSQRGNSQVQVFIDENKNPNDFSTAYHDSTNTNEPVKSVVRSIIDAARDQENQKEPGPWNRAHSRKKGKLFGAAKAINEIGFEIHEDLNDDSENLKKPCIPPIRIAEFEIKFDKPFVYSANFCACSKPITGWITPVTTEDIPDANTLPKYNKCKLYPRPNMEFQPEELKAYNILKKRGIQNKFTKARDKYWVSGPLFSIRLYPNFATKSKVKKTDAMDTFFMPEKVPGLKVPFDEIYKEKENVERQFEEILFSRIKRNLTITEAADMEETMCTTSDKVQRRKSFFPMRKSMAAVTFKSSMKTSVMPEQNANVETPSENELAPNASIVPESSKVIEEKCELNTDNIQKERLETPQALWSQQILPTIVPVKNAESENLVTQNKMKTYSQSQVVTEKVDSKTVSPIPFEIFKDESAVEVKCIQNVQDASDFQFKTPALPIPSSSSVAAVPRKLPFEIFDDDNLQQKSPEIGCGTGGFFDAEETCSTQTFNIFLKAQSVSTPIAAVKAKPQRQFGNILKEVLPPEQKADAIIEIQTPTSAEEICANENQNLVPNNSAFSPARERLSTILETSEHGTTQGTHTTGATTKSTFSSPEFDMESHMQATANVGLNLPHPVLETVKELSCETSVDKLMESLKIQNVDKSISKSLPSTKPIETPAAMRLQNKYTTDCLEKSIFELSIKNDDGKQVGNFSRLEEKEDTAAGLAFKALPSIRFQDDKTETIPKMLITSQQFKFPDEKTETISKILFEPPMPLSKYLEDKTETVPKVFVDPPSSVKFPDDKTETISKLMLETLQFKKSEEEETELKHVEKGKSSLQSDRNQDDPFEFFRHSPPKSVKHCFTKEVSLPQVRTADECRTPLAFDSKRFCGNDTNPIVLFEDELQPDLKSKHSVDIKTNMKDSFLSDFLLIEENQQNTVKPKSKSVFRDSFIPDFSLIEDSQPQSKQIQSKSQLKAAPNKSILPEFSFIENTQPKSTMPNVNNTGNISTVSLQTNQIQYKSQTKASSNESILPEFSFIQNTQPKSSQPEQNNTRNTSKVSDFFHVPETPSDQSIIKPSQTTEPRRFQQSFLPSSSASKNYSTNNKTDVNISWKQIPKSNISSQLTQDGTNMKNILMDNFLKDLSEIKEPPPITNDAKQISLVKSHNNNTSFKFLSESLKQKSENTKNNSNCYAFKRISIGEDAKLQNCTSKSTEDKMCGKDSQPHGNDTDRSGNTKNNQKSYTANSISSGKETKLKFLTPIATEDKIRGKNSSDIDKFFELNCETEMFGTNISMIKNSTWLPNHGPTLSSNPYQVAQIHEKSLHIKPENISTVSTASAETSNQDWRRQRDSSAKPKICVDAKPQFNNDISIQLSTSELAVINANSFRKNADNTIVIPESPEENDADNNMSIYYKKTPKTPKPQLHIWDDSEAFKSNAQNQYIHAEPDLNSTHQLIENITIDPNVNPFNVDLINAFLEKNYVISYLEKLPTCKLVGCIQRLKPNAQIDINGISFSVQKLIGEGAYGAVFRGKETSTGKQVAMKQEKPPNFWEYYICLEIQERISSDEMLQAYMSVDYALIGNNSSILISKLSYYGSLITVCNKIKKVTMKNVDEYVVMLLASELLEIIDHLHAVNIIHADVKADNFLLMNKLTYPPTERHLQLIDFGVSIDMELFKNGQTFSFVHNESLFKCPEMRENRPWTYQLDLYGIAVVIHVLLFGKYMDIEKKARGFWMHKTNVPRYINKVLWDEIFKTLLNIRDCKSMPNLQDLRALLKKEMEEKENYVVKMVNEFNRAISM